MSEVNLNENLRLIYLKEDILALGRRLLRNLSFGNFSMSKAVKEKLPPLKSLEEYAKKVFDDYDLIRRYVESKGKNLRNDQKTICAMTITAAKDMQKEPSLREHAEEILHSLTNDLEKGLIGASETTFFLYMVNLLLDAVKRPFLASKVNFLARFSASLTFLVVILYFCSISLYFITVVLRKYRKRRTNKEIIDNDFDN